MLAKIGVFVVLTFCLLAGQSKAQECAAESVVNLKLDTSHKLTWSLRPGEPCPIAEFLVYIYHPGQPAEYAITVKDPEADVSFLKVCEEWIFVVVPVSGHTMGGQRRLMASLPLPADADLSLAYMNVYHDPTTEFTRLYWDLTDDRLANCSLRYRVTVEQEGSPVIEDFYVDEKHINLNFLSSCTRYQFGIRVINIASPTVEGPLRSATHELFGRKQYPPYLLDSKVGTTWINMTFRLESKVRNPCPLRQLYVDGDGNISQSIALSNDGDRVPVNVFLDNLEPNRRYRFNVYVANTAGWSVPAVVYFATLPEDLMVESEVQPPAIEKDN